MAADTKTRIIDGALELFNARGTGNVTTNHISEALGMSPGNLYYHFRNKAEIVRALFGRITAAWAENYAMPADVMPGIGLVEQMMAGNFEIQWKYRFFFRDLTMLLQADAELAADYRASREASYGNTLFLLNLFIDAGAIESPGDAQGIDDLAQLLWLVGDFWLVFKDVGGGPIGPAEMDQGVRLFRRLLNPTHKGSSK